MSSFGQEQHLVAKAFQSGMADFRQEPIVLYGIGKNTEAVLTLTEGFSFVGLLDRDEENIGKTIYGQPVLSLEASGEVSKLIVIIARMTITPIIYKRIRDFTREHGVSVYDYAGRLITDDEDAYDPAGLDYWDHSWDELKGCIAQHDVISFDIFDTLLGRYVLQPTDVFFLVERDIRAAGRNIPFAELRVEAEKKCGYAASLDEIYEMLHQDGISQEDCLAWREYEFSWEEKVSYPRKRMVDALVFAKGLGKQVYLTSDMYLSKREMEQLLARKGIFGYDGLLISCEEKLEKSDGRLYKVLLAEAVGKSLLHIGDNRYSDIDMANRMGIDTWQIWSAYDLFMASTVHNLLSGETAGLGMRLSLGQLSARLFADPFALHETRGRLSLTTLEGIACFLGPWVLAFMQWASEQVICHQIEQFIFPSRDGFLFYRIAKQMQRHGAFPGVEICYIKASRRAYAVASVLTVEDLRKTLAYLPQFPTNEELLKGCFRLVPESEDKRLRERPDWAGQTFACLERYATQILEESAWERNNLQKYLYSQSLTNPKNAAIFDFVAKGTVQYYLEKQLKRQLLGLYCATMSHPNELFPGSGHVLSAFGNITPYGGDSILSRVYLSLEALLVDGDGTLEYFDEAGQPVIQSTRDFSYRQQLSIQESIIGFVEQYLCLWEETPIKPQETEIFLNVLFSESCIIDEAIAGAFVHDDANEVSTKDIILPQ